MAATPSMPPSPPRWSARAGDVSLLRHRRRPLRPIVAGQDPRQEAARLPRQRHRPPRRLPRVHARARRGRPGWPPRDGPARAPLSGGAGSWRGASPCWSATAASRSRSWPNRPSATPPMGSRFRPAKRIASSPRPTCWAPSRRARPSSCRAESPCGRATGCAAPDLARSSRSSPRTARTPSTGGPIAKEIGAYLALRTAAR